MMDEAWRYIKTILRICGVLALGLLLLISWNALERKKAKEQAELIFMRDKGEGAVLLSMDGCVVLDAGDEEGGKHLFELLKSRGVDKIDCLVLSSPADRHIKGAAYLLDHIEISQILTPYYEGGSENFRSLRDKALMMRIPMYPIYRHRLFHYGELDIRVFAPEKFYYDEQKNYTLAFSFQHGEVSGLFLHGGGRERIGEVLRLPKGEVDICSLSEKIKEEEKTALLEKLSPEILIEDGMSAGSYISDARKIRRQGGE